jgi:hypothetical protein
MILPLLLAAGVTLALVGVAVLFVWLWADVIGMARQFGLREAAPGFAIVATITGLILLLLALLIHEAPRAFGAL